MCNVGEGETDDKDRDALLGGETFITRKSECMVDWRKVLNIYLGKCLLENNKCVHLFLPLKTTKAQISFTSVHVIHNLKVVKE